jgi:hypothetical protein
MCACVYHLQGAGQNHNLVIGNKFFRDVVKVGKFGNGSKK